MDQANTDTKREYDLDDIISIGDTYMQNGDLAKFINELEPYTTNWDLAEAATEPERLFEAVFTIVIRNDLHLFEERDGWRRIRPFDKAQFRILQAFTERDADTKRSYSRATDFSESSTVDKGSAKKVHTLLKSVPTIKLKPTDLPQLSDELKEVLKKNVELVGVVDKTALEEAWLAAHKATHDSIFGKEWSRPPKNQKKIAPWTNHRTMIQDGAIGVRIKPIRPVPSKKTSAKRYWCDHLLLTNMEMKRDARMAGEVLKSTSMKMPLLESQYYDLSSIVEFEKHFKKVDINDWLRLHGIVNAGCTKVCVYQLRAVKPDETNPTGLECTIFYEGGIATEETMELYMRAMLKVREEMRDVVKELQKLKIYVGEFGQAHTLGVAEKKSEAEKTLSKATKMKDAHKEKGNTTGSRKPLHLPGSSTGPNNNSNDIVAAKKLKTAVKSKVPAANTTVHTETADASGSLDWFKSMLNKDSNPATKKQKTSLTTSFATQGVTEKTETNVTEAKRKTSLLLLQTTSKNTVPTNQTSPAPDLSSATKHVICVDSDDDVPVVAQYKPATKASLTTAKKAKNKTKKAKKTSLVQPIASDEDDGSLELCDSRDFD